MLTHRGTDIHEVYQQWTANQHCETIFFQLQDQQEMPLTPFEENPAIATEAPNIEEDSAITADAVWFESQSTGKPRKKKKGEERKAK